MTSRDQAAESPQTWGVWELVLRSAVLILSNVSDRNPLSAETGKRFLWPLSVPFAGPWQGPGGSWPVTIQRAGSRCQQHLGRATSLSQVFAEHLPTLGHALGSRVRRASWER